METVCARMGYNSRRERRDSRWGGQGASSWVSWLPPPVAGGPCRQRAGSWPGRRPAGRGAAAAEGRRAAGDCRAAALPPAGGRGGDAGDAPAGRTGASILPRAGEKGRRFRTLRDRLRRRPAGSGGRFGGDRPHQGMRAPPPRRAGPCLSSSRRGRACTPRWPVTVDPERSAPCCMPETGRCTGRLPPGSAGGARAGSGRGRAGIPPSPTGCGRARRHHRA